MLSDINIRLVLIIAFMAILSGFTASGAVLAQEQSGTEIEVEVDKEALDAAFEAGDHETLYRLAVGYAEAGAEDFYPFMCVSNWFGVGTEKGVKAAFEWCAAPENGDGFSKAIVSIVNWASERLEAATDQPQDYLSRLEDGAKAGDATAMQLVADAYREGLFQFDFGKLRPKKDTETAKYWTERAAEAGEPKALTRVADRWLHSTDPELHARAFSYLERAAQQGVDPEVLIRIAGRGLRSTDPELQAPAVSFMERAVEQGYASAASQLAFFYRAHSEGEPSIKANEMLLTSLEWERKAAALDPRYAIYVVYTLQDRDGSFRDQDEAIKWMQIGADAGELDAMVALADAFLNGEGVRRNTEEARKWYQTFFAAVEDAYMPVEGARAGLGLLAIAQEDNNRELLVETIPRLLKVVEGKDFEGLAGKREKTAVHYALGVAHRDGVGLERNLDKALQHFSRAADEGHALAARERDFIIASRARFSADTLSALQARLSPPGRASYGGYLEGPIDGIWGRSTFNALRAWQCVVGEPVTGQVDERLLQRIMRNEEGEVWFGPEVWTERLFDAIGKGDIDCIRAAMQNGANLTAIHQSSDVMERLGYGRSSFWGYQDHVAQGEKYEIAKILVAAGAPLRIGSIFSFVSGGDHQIVEMFLERGVNPLGRIEGKTLIEWAAYYDQPRVAEVLIKFGATPLSEAQKAQERLTGISPRVDDGGAHKAREALEAGAWINGPSIGGRTALVQALRGPISQPGILNYLRFLLDAGADPNKVADAGFSGLDGVPLHLLIYFNGDRLDGEKEYAEKSPHSVHLAREALHLLLESGAKVGAKDSVGRTPLHIATERGSLYTAQVLVSEGALVDVRDDKGRRPIDYAEDADVIAFLQNPSSAKIEPERSGVSYGSGFVISSGGHVLTNSHVVESCAGVSASLPNGDETMANLLAKDQVNDVAVLALPVDVSGLSLSPLPIRSNDINLGESVLVAGFPFGDIVSSELKVTSGIVNSLKGPGNDVSKFQLDAAIQPGNSGGPILDRGGNVIGVVVAQLDKRVVEQQLGSIPENVNFGIKASVLETFLTSNGVEYIEGTLEKLDSIENVAQTARAATLMLTCHE